MFLPNITNTASFTTLISPSTSNDQVNACFWGIYNEIPADLRAEFELICYMWKLYFLRKIIELKLKIVWKKGHIDKKLVKKKYSLWKKFKDRVTYSTDIFDDSEAFEIAAQFESKIQKSLIRSCSRTIDNENDKYKESISSAWYEQYLYLTNGLVLDLGKDKLPGSPEEVASYEKRIHYGGVLDFSLTIEFDDNTDRLNVGFAFNNTDGEEWSRFNLSSDILDQSLLNLL